MPRRPTVPLLVFAAVAFVAAACLTWFVADLRYDIGLPRCGSGRRFHSCGRHGWHDTSGLVSSLLALPMLFLVVGTYLVLSSRLVRAAKAKRRDALRSGLRRRFALVLLVAVLVAVPATMAVRSTF